MVLGDGAQTTLYGRRITVGTESWAPEAITKTSDTVTRLLIPYTYQTASEEHRTVKYAPRYRLAFTLLNEDATTSQAALSWDIGNALHDNLQPALDRLSLLHNFSVESQVQYHAPLAFSPHSIEWRGAQAHSLTPEDLTVFVNSAEWTLASSVSNDPVLHFVLFVPSSINAPLYILDHEGNPTSSDAFILPQWGGVVLLNKPDTHLTSASLAPTFKTFQRQLLALLGVPSLPQDVISNDLEPFSDWQLDALVRQRARQNFENSKETLGSIVSLVHQIENMPVGQDVKGDVQGSLNALDSALATAKSSSTAALRHSSEALTLSSRAFFNPGMLALLYFPAEHKYAVYTPLFASIAAPLVAAVIREVVAWKKTRRAATVPQPAQRQRVD